MDDFDAMSEIEAGPEHRVYLGWIPDPDKRRAGLQRTIERSRMRGYGLLGIEFAEGQPGLIGYCGLLPSEVGAGNSVEIVCSVLERHWDQGIAAEACRRVLAWALEQPSFPRIVGRVADSNDRSRRLVKKLGMEFWRDRQDLVNGVHEEIFSRPPHQYRDPQLVE